MSAIKMKFNNLPSFGKRSGRELAKGLQIDSPPSCTRAEHLSIHELHKNQAESLRNVLPLLMDSLPDPPQLSVTDLAQLEMMARLNEINLPSIKNASTLSNPPSSECANLPSVAVRVLPTSLLLMESGLKENSVDTAESSSLEIVRFFFPVARKPHTLTMFQRDRNEAEVETKKK
ncbi:unnamed protein product [Angiostrongylus costaricensis]|uniref:Uncharacterized protein n=1 Tax=Angiostrongylus costaricensis TaxID=334426 RepID=A0A0R3PMA9_ANGCS|nr:unnamed protein product [Angiostrongylus costaricensis]